MKYVKLGSVVVGLSSLLPTLALAAGGKDLSSLQPWNWTESADGLVTTSVWTVQKAVASTTGWATPWFWAADDFIYLTLGVVTAIAVMLLLRKSIGRLVKGMTRH